MKQKSVAIFVISGVVLIALGLYATWAYYRMEVRAQELESQVVTPRTDASTVSEVGYILSSRTTRDFSLQQKKISWSVKILATNETWSCNWVQGFAQFKDNDSVLLIHKPTGGPDGGDWDAYLVGMHNPNKNKVAQVWALSLDDYIPDDPNEHRVLNKKSPYTLSRLRPK